MCYESYHEFLQTYFFSAAMCFIDYYLINFDISQLRMFQGYIVEW